MQSSFSFSIRPSTNRRSIPATSKATFPVCARTAASTLTAPFGLRWLSRSWEKTNARGNFSLCSIPYNTARPPKQIATYKVEPYVVAADVYAVAPHIGRGGWTWYTGSAGWMYRFLTETLLGVHLEGNRLRVIPRFPPSWTNYKIHYRHRQTVYHITISRLGAGSDWCK